MVGMVSGICISTHSLTRRLTYVGLCDWCSQRISTHSLTRRLTHSADCQKWVCNHFNSQPHKEADVQRLPGIIQKFISTHSLTRRLTVSFTGEKFRRSISTHSLTRRLTAILFNKNCFVQLIFITLYQSSPQPLLLPPFFHPIFIFSARISGANLPRIGWGLGVRTIGSGCR